MSSAPVEFPYFRLATAKVKRPLLWLLLENPHDAANPGFKYLALELIRK